MHRAFFFCCCSSLTKHRKLASFAFMCVRETLVVLIFIDVLSNFSLTSLFTVLALDFDIKACFDVIFLFPLLFLFHRCGPGTAC